MKRWTAIAPFETSDGAGWLAPFVDASRHEVRILGRRTPERNWHTKIKGVTSGVEWIDYARHARRAWAAPSDGIITVFPQLAVLVGLRKLLSLRRHRPVIAWCLNIGQLYGGAKRQLAKAGLGQVDCCVVHASREREHYANWLGLPVERFKFVHLQRGLRAPTHHEETASPFLLAMGSSHRDYRTLIEAIRPLGIRTVIVASPRSIEGLDLPPFVEFRTGLSREACQTLAEQARLNVVPIANEETASGQVTVVEAMWMARPVVATRCLGTEDYIDHGADGLLVRRGDPDDLRASIASLWDDAEKRCRLGAAARRRALAQFSDKHAGEELTRILDSFIAR